MFGETMNIYGNLYGMDDRESIVAAIGEGTGFNPLTAAQLYEYYTDKIKENPSFKFDSKETQDYIEKFTKDPGSYDSTEMKLFTSVEQIRTRVTDLGMKAVEDKLKDIPNIYHDINDIWAKYCESKEKDAIEERIIDVDREFASPYAKFEGLDAKANNILKTAVGEDNYAGAAWQGFFGEKLPWIQSMYEDDGKYSAQEIRQIFHAFIQYNNMLVEFIRASIDNTAAIKSLEDKLSEVIIDERNAGR